MEGLSSAERALLADHLGRLEGVLGPGFTRINWNSLAISDFAAGAEKVRALTLLFSCLLMGNWWPVEAFRAGGACTPVSNS